MLNPEMIKGLIERAAYILVPLLVAYLVTSGLLPEEMSETFTTTVITIILLAAGAFLGIKQNTQSSLVIATSKMPDVKEVVLDDRKLAAELNAKTPNDARITSK